ncbi:hypothetical protein ES707_07552 [subsurface metagenome]
MWFFDLFESYFLSLDSFFGWLAKEAGKILYFGDSLNYWLLRIGDLFRSLALQSRYASDWSDGIVAGINAINARAWEAWLAVTGWIPRDLNEAIAKAKEAWDYAKDTLKPWIDEAKAKALEALTFAKDTLKPWIDDVVKDLGKVWDYVQNTLKPLIDKAKEKADEAWSLVQGLPTLEDLQKLVIDWVKAELDILVLAALELVDTDWKSFESPLVRIQKGMIKLVQDNALTLADAAWECADEIVGKLVDEEEE